MSYKNNKTKSKKEGGLSERVMTSDKIEEVLHKINYAEKLANHERIWFKNIPGVRKNGIQWGWTDEEIEEYTKCKLDVHYFAEKYCKIKREDGSVGEIELRPYQKDILDLFFNNRYSILCASRQSGKCLVSNTLIRIKYNNIEETISLIDLFKKYYSIIDLNHNEIWNGNLEDKLYKSLSIIKENIFVLSITGWVKIEELNITKKINTFTLITKSGRTLTGAGEHMIMTPNGWNCLINLKQGDKIMSGIDIDEVDNIIDNNQLEILYDLTTESGDYLSAGNIINKFDLSTVKNSNITSIRHDFTLCKRRIKSFFKENGQSLDSFLNSSILSHNTISASIFILHYITFNQDKGVMIAANKSKTTQEILDKIKNIYKLLPYFLKVGLVNWGAKSLSFENGCRVQTEARSKEPSIGFTIDLLYLDEFAHIPANIIEPYYKSVVPTVSSISNSKIIITSTPNGFNLFHKLWEGASLPKGHPGKNPYRPLKVLWHEVTDKQGRRYREDAWLQFNPLYMAKHKITEDMLFRTLTDAGAILYKQKQADEDTGETVEFLAVQKTEGFKVEELRASEILGHKLIDLFSITTWYEREIKLIGGKENFDQEYNLHFLAGSKRVLEPDTLQLIARDKVEFVWKYNSTLEKRFGEGGYDFIKWHPDLYDSIDFKNDYIFASVDLSEGLGQDYTVFNIFKLCLKSKHDLELKGVKNIQDAFQLKQIGILHSNRLSVDIDAPEFFYTIFFEMFNPMRTKIALEYNTFGSTLIAALPQVYNSNNKFGKYIFIKYKHRMNDTQKSIGVKLNSENKKIYVKNYVIKLGNNSVIVYELNTANEINNFVRHETSAGNYVYRAEIGHDDIVMSLVHACTIPDDASYVEACKSLFVTLDSATKTLISSLIGFKDTNNKQNSYSMLHGARSVNYGKYAHAFDSRENGRFGKYLTGNE